MINLQQILEARSKLSAVLAEPTPKWPSVAYGQAEHLSQCRRVLEAAHDYYRAVILENEDVKS